MSIQFTVTCLDCRKLAPSLGDGGFLGGLIDPASPFMETLRPFLKTHRQHPLEARLRESA